MGTKGGSKREFKVIVTFIYLMAMEEEKYVLFSLFKCNIFIYLFIKNMTKKMEGNTKKWMILLIHSCIQKW